MIISPGSLLQQHLDISMHAGELLGDGVLRPVLLLRQALDPPDLGQELTDLLVYIPAILLGHKSTGSPGFSFRYSLSLYSFASSEILSVMGSIILNYSSCLPILFDIRYPYLLLQLASLAILPFLSPHKRHRNRGLPPLELRSRWRHHI